MLISCLPEAVSCWSQLLRKPVLDWQPYDLLTDYRQCEEVRIFLLSSVFGLGVAGPLAALELEYVPDGARGDYLNKYVCWTEALARLHALANRRTEVLETHRIGSLCKEARGSLHFMQTGAGGAFADLLCVGDESSEDTVEILAPRVRRKWLQGSDEPLYFKVASGFLTEEWFRHEADNELYRISAIEAMEKLTSPVKAKRFPELCIPLLLSVALFR